MKKQFVRAASIDNMLSAFESKIAELEGEQGIESATTVDMLDAFQSKIDELEGVDFTTDINASDDGIVEEELEPVQGSENYQPFMLMEYEADSGENGPEADYFDCIGKFFAKDEKDAEEQLESAFAAEPDRMGCLANPYVTEYNEYFDDGQEVYEDLMTLIQRNILIGDEQPDAEFDEDGFPVYNSTEIESVEAGDNMYNAAYSFDAIESKVDAKEQELWDLKDDNPEVGQAIEEFDARHHGEYEPLRFVLEVGYGLSPDDYTGVAPFTVYITNPEIKPDESNDMLKEIADPNSIEIYDDITGASTTDDDEEYIGDYQDDYDDYDSEEDDEDILNVHSNVNTDPNNWEQIDSKSIRDFDGFLTEYTLYKNSVTGLYVCVFGDSEMYRPEDGEWDAEFDDYDRAIEWFNNYTTDED